MRAERGISIGIGGIGSSGRRNSTMRSKGSERPHALQLLGRPAVPALAFGYPSPFGGQLGGTLGEGPAHLADEALGVVVEVDQGLGPALGLLLTTGDPP